MSALAQNTKEKKIKHMKDNKQKRKEKIIKMPGVSEEEWDSDESSVPMNEIDRPDNSASNVTKEKYKIILQIISTVASCIAVLVSVFGFVYTNGFKMGKLDEKLNNIESDLASIQEDVDDLNLAIDGDLANGVNGLSARVKSLEDGMTKLEDNRKVEITIVNNDNNKSKESIPDLDIVANKQHKLKAYNPDTEVGVNAADIICTASDLKGKQVLLSYEVNSQKNYLLGRISNNYYWDGICIVNTYNADDSFYGVTKYTIENGHILKYESFHQDKDNVNTWTYTDRTITDNGKSGISISYYLDYEKPKDFTDKSVRVSDILYISDFLSIERKRMLKYYNGLTIGEDLNDSTGNAYEIILNDDGTVKTLYVGKFKDGKFEDDSGNAWEIAYAKEYNIYVHNTGVFDENVAVHGSNKPLTQEEIDKIISDYEREKDCRFDIRLNWKFDN